MNVPQLVSRLQKLETVKAALPRARDFSRTERAARWAGLLALAAHRGTDDNPRIARLRELYDAARARQEAVA
ncbi:MAG: hypothetical protein AB1578_18155 [Thermodesulfobacteriota bacterium]